MPEPIREPDPDRGGTRRGAEGAPRCGRRMLRGARWTAGGLLGLVLISVTTTAVLEAIDRRRIAAPGDLVELADGRRLHLHVDGPVDSVTTGAPNRPTVVLEAGSGGFSASMAWLRHELAEYTTVVAYDRAGYGFSDPTEAPLDGASVTADLREALQRRGLDGPYLLVGHSLGAGYVRVFAAHHPEEVVGLVLLDPVHEEQMDRLPVEATDALALARQQLAVAPLLARLGTFRLIDAQRGIAASLPEDAGEQHRARSVTAAGMRAYGREVAVLSDLLDELARTAGGVPGEAFGGLPVHVISATEPGEGETREAMDGMHVELAARSPRGNHLTVIGADHLGLVFDAAHAREVAAAVVGLLDELTDSGAAGGHSHR